MAQGTRLQDLADALGLNASTVSRALSDHPKIATATRKRVQAMARVMGYVPDPALKRLAQRRWEGTKSERSVSLAFVVWSHTDYPRTQLATVPIAQKEGRQLGYGFETCVISDFPSPTAAARMLLARGVSGLIVMASTHPDAWQGFPIDEFSGIELLAGSGRATGYSLVRDDVFGIMVDAGERILARHPCSAAICLFKQNRLSQTDVRDYAAALMVVSIWREAGMNCPEPQFFDNTEAERLRMARWIKESHIEMVIVPNSGISWELGEVGLRIKEDVDVFALRLLGVRDLAGYERPLDVIIRQAIRQLDVMVRNDEKGVPANKQTTVVRSTWYDGSQYG